MRNSELFFICCLLVRTRAAPIASGGCSVTLRALQSQLHPARNQCVVVGRAKNLWETTAVRWAAQPPAPARCQVRFPGKVEDGRSIRAFRGGAGPPPCQQTQSPGVCRVMIAQLLPTALRGV